MPQLNKILSNINNFKGWRNYYFHFAWPNIVVHEYMNFFQKCSRLFMSVNWMSIDVPTKYWPWESSATGLNCPRKLLNQSKENRMECHKDTPSWPSRSHLAMYVCTVQSEFSEYEAIWPYGKAFVVGILSWKFLCIYSLDKYLFVCKRFSLDGNYFLTILMFKNGILADFTKFQNKVKITIIPPILIIFVLFQYFYYGFTTLIHLICYKLCFRRIFFQV